MTLNPAHLFLRYPLVNLSFWKSPDVAENHEKYEGFARQDHNPRDSCRGLRSEEIQQKYDSPGTEFVVSQACPNFGGSSRGLGIVLCY